MSLVKAIGFCGKAFSGKDTAAEIWREAHPSYGKLALADPLKQDCVNWDLCSAEEAWVTKPPRVRRLLQVYGTELRRQYDSNYWLCRWADAYLRGLRSEDEMGLAIQLGLPGAVVPDLRYPNEVYYFLNELQIPVLFIGAEKRLLREGRSLEKGAAQHASENQCGKIISFFGRHPHFHVVDNNGGLRDFVNTVLDTLTGITE